MDIPDYAFEIYLRAFVSAATGRAYEGPVVPVQNEVAVGALALGTSDGVKKDGVRDKKTLHRDLRLLLSPPAKPAAP